MEGAGLYAACQDYKVDWILVKSICDWADGNKARNKNKWQQLAANNAASFVLHMLQQVPFVGKSKEYESIPALVEDATNDIYKIRQTEEAKNNAKVIDMHLAKYSAPEFQKIAELYKKENQSTEKTNFYPLYPLYLPNDIDFVVKCDITKFDYDLSSAIYNFYSDLRKAEDCRLYIEENCINQDTRIQTLCVIKFQDMKSTIISCSNKISDIRSQLKEICNYSASPKPVG